jgi:hypothetical protein
MRSPLVLSPAGFEWKWFVVPLVLVVLLYWVGSRLLFTLDGDPITLPLLELSEERERELGEVQRAVSHTLSTGAALDITLSADLLNAWVKLSPREELRIIGEHTWLTLRDGMVVAQISLPLELFGKPGFYFNGSGVFSGALQDGRLTLSIKELSSTSSAASGVAYAIKALGGDRLIERLKLHEAIPEALLKRCNALLSGDTLRLLCAPLNRSRDES